MPADRVHPPLGPTVFSPPRMLCALARSPTPDGTNIEPTAVTACSPSLARVGSNTEPALDAELHDVAPHRLSWMSLLARVPPYRRLGLPRGGSMHLLRRGHRDVTGRGLSQVAVVERPGRLGARHRLGRIHDDFERPRPERYSFIIRAWRRSISALKALGRDGCRL